MSLTGQLATRARWLRKGSPGPEPATPSLPAGAPVDPAASARLETTGGAPERIHSEAPPRRRATTPGAARPRTAAAPRGPARRRVAPLSSTTPTAPAVAEVLDAGRMHDVRVLLVEDVPEVVERIRELLRSQGDIKVAAVTSDGRRVEDDIAEHRPDVIIVDALLQGRMKGPVVIERLRRARNPLPCVAITLGDSPLSAELERSVDSVLTLPFGTFDLVRAIRDAVLVGASRNPTLASRVIAVFSAKGGVGKTTLALNLAVALGEMGLRTALVDGSLQFGDLRRLLGAADDAPSIIDLPTDSVRSSDLVELMVRGPADVEVLLAPPRLEQAELITTRDIEKILGMLRRTYHAVVIDTPNSLGETTLALLDAADLIIQVVTPETAALDITRIAAEAFSGIGYPDAKLQLLLNRADAQGPVSHGQIRAVFGRDPDYTVSSDWTLVAQSNARGVPFVSAGPDAPISADVRAVAGRVAAVVGAPRREKTERERRRVRA